MKQASTNAGRMPNNYRVLVYGDKAGYGRSRNKGLFGFKLIDTLTDSVTYVSHRSFQSHKLAMMAGKEKRDELKKGNAAT